MTAWEHLAACRNAPDPEIFFNHHRLDEANRYCARCPVVLACREAGKTAYRGIWASPNGDLDIVLSAEQWTDWIALIQAQIDLAALEVESSGSSFRFSRFFGRPEQLEPYLGKASGVES